jgi:cyclase
MSFRIIPRLDVKGRNLVKGIHLEGLRILGPIEPYAQYYYEQGADELLYVDAVASLYGRNSLTDVIADTARNISIPLAVGGGIRSLQDMEEILRAGADKVALNTAAIGNPGLIREAANAFGSSTVVINIEAVRNRQGEAECFVDNGREPTGVLVEDWIKVIEDHGAGEILLTSVDREGTGRGFDLELTKSVATSMSIPVIACGGAGAVSDVETVIKDGAADAVCVAALLHYYAKDDLAVDGLSELAFAASADLMNARNRIDGTSLRALKKFLNDGGIDVRRL